MAEKTASASLSKVLTENGWTMDEIANFILDTCTKEEIMQTSPDFVSI